jgi:glycosyltransferase involved in cell wall biosynthesis
VVSGDPIQPAPRPLRVGLNLIFLGERAGGAGRYARALPGALLEAEPETEIDVFVSRDAPADLSREPWAQDVRLLKLPVTMHGPPLHVPAEYLLLPLLAAARRLDVLHSPANTGPAITPGVASVVSVLDLIWWHRPEEWEASPRVHRTMRRRVGRAARGADRIFAISEAAASDLVATLGIERERIDVTPLGTRLGHATPGTHLAHAQMGHGVSERTGAAQLGTEQAGAERELRAELELGDTRVVLCVAQKRPYKNLHRLVRALPALEPDVMLVLAGAPTAHEQELRRLADELGVAQRVRFPEWLSEEQLEGLYALCSAFALPSLIEGFGLPVLEAMLRGAPVACSDTSSLPEVAGDAALLFDPERQEEVDGAIRRLLEDRALAERLRARGRERAARFTWEQTGAASLAGYRRAMAHRAGSDGRSAAGRHSGSDEHPAASRRSG